MRRSRLVAIDAILFALIVLFTIISAAVPTGIVSIAFLMLLPVLVAAQIERISTAVFAGAVLGIMSLITAFIFPKPTSSLFYNPLVSVLPRIMIGVVSWLVFRYLNKALARLKKNKSLKFIVTSAISASIGVVTNTALVLAMVWLLFNGKEVGGMIIDAAFITGILSINFVIEIVICTVIIPPITYAVKRSLKQPLSVNGFGYLKKLNELNALAVPQKDYELEVYNSNNSDSTSEKGVDIADIDSLTGVEKKIDKADKD